MEKNRDETSDKTEIVFSREILSVSVRTDGFDIIKSGMAIGIDENSSIQIDVNCARKRDFSIIFSFEKDDSKDYRIDRKLNEESSVFTITCTNVDKYGGVGTSNPIVLGSYTEDGDEKKILLHFWITPVGKRKISKLEYELLLEK